MVVELSDQSIEKLVNLLSQKSSPTVDIIVSLIPIVGIIGGCFVFFSIFLFYYKQRILIIQTGNYKPFKVNWNLVLILTGMVTTFVGIAITTVFIINKVYGFELLGGLIPLFTGLAIIFTYIISNKVRSGREENNR
ncbi:MAG TPA: hypothetical protein PKW55_05640 [Spirochaetota bacterium]|nr:hypothetical protein [Spirochaetota bacterium]HOM37566.1 hypothetical protein [Spirochaetota bacterium]HPQ49463.1 hypothetical protein [Spirochaetota bacterium]